MNLEAASAPYRDNIVTANVRAVIPGKGSKPHGLLIDDGQTIFANSIILAVGEEAFDLLNEAGCSPKRSISATSGHLVEVYMAHVRGNLKTRIAVRPSLSHYCFLPSSQACALARQHDGSYLLFYKNGVLTKADLLGALFQDYEIVAEQDWSKAFRVGPRQTIGEEIGSRIFLAGQHNLPGLEDCYLSGVYAAKRAANCTNNNLPLS